MKKKNWFIVLSLLLVMIVGLIIGLSIGNVKKNQSNSEDEKIKLVKVYFEK